MRILMLGNSLTSAQDMPDILAELTGAEVVCHTRGGARLSEHLNPNTRLVPERGGTCKGAVGLCGAAGNEPRPHHRSRELFRQRGAALPADPGERGHPGALCHLGLSEGWGPAVGQGMGLWRDGPEPVRGVPQGGGGKPRLLADVGRRFYQLLGTQDLYAADGVHPSGQGARIAAETIAAAIQRHKEDPS